MKFLVGDTVKIVGGKDKGKSGVIKRVLPAKNAVIVEGINVYTKHIKPMMGRSGEKTTVERPLPTAKIAIINNKGEVDRIGYQVGKDGQKTRIYRKTGKPVASQKLKESKTTKKAKK